jgi:hypothetical protein
MGSSGEYSDACVCELPARSAETARSSLLESGGSGGGAVGVVMQMRAAQNRQRR